MTTQSQQPADELLAHALASGRTIAAAAQTAGVSESTAYRRLREPGFRARVDELRAVLLDAVTGQLTSETLTARQVLSSLLRSPSEATQLRAAKTMIELAFRINDRGRRAGLLEPHAEPTTDTTAPEISMAVAAEPEPPGAAVSWPAELSVPVELGSAPPPAVAAGSGEPNSTRDTCTGEAPAARPEIEVTAESERARNLSKPVTDCHRRVRPKRAGHSSSLPPVEHHPGGEERSWPNQVDRLSAGLTDAIERAGNA